MSSRPPSTSPSTASPKAAPTPRPAIIPSALFAKIFWCPFQAAVQEAHVGSVMASYNEIDGIPSHINPWLLNRVLRQEWGFRGYVTSDGDGLQMLIETHHVAANKPTPHAWPLPPALTTTSPTAPSIARCSGR